MSNLFGIGSHPFRGGFIGYFRRVHKASNEILKDANGAEIIFPSQAEAEAAAGKAAGQVSQWGPVLLGNYSVDPRRAEEHGG